MRQRQFNHRVALSTCIANSNNGLATVIQSVRLVFWRHAHGVRFPISLLYGQLRASHPFNAVAQARGKTYRSAHDCMALEGYVFPDLQGTKLSLVIKRTVTDFIDDELPTYSSALAFQLFFSLFPFLLFLVALIGVLDLQPFFDWLRQQAALVMPPMAMELIDSVIEQLQTQEIGLFSLSILLALWTASAAVRSVMDATNKVYGIKEGRPVWKRFALSLFHTVIIAAALLLAAGFMVLGPQLLNWLAQYLGIEQLAIQLWTWLRWPLVVALLMLAVAVVYYVAPGVQPAFRIIPPPPAQCLRWGCG
jgi:membrane protein